MAAAGKEMALRVAAAIRLRPVDINVTKEEFCDFFEEICAKPEFVAEESIIFKSKAVDARGAIQFQQDFQPSLQTQFTNTVTQKQLQGAQSKSMLPLILETTLLSTIRLS